MPRRSRVHGEGHKKGNAENEKTKMGHGAGAAAVAGRTDGRPDRGRTGNTDQHRDGVQKKTLGKGQNEARREIRGGTEIPTLEKVDGQRHVFDDADAAEPGEPKNDRKELAMEEHRYDNTKPCTAPKNRYEVLEAATDGMTGIRAICTADAILCLWQWERPEDLKRAKAAIDYMLKKTEAQE